MRLDVKSIENTYVIGDVHGCFYTLQRLIQQLPTDATVIFLGDLCDRGLHTKEVIEFVIENGHYCLLGNHDDYMISHIHECMEDPDLQIRWNSAVYMGGKETLLSYANDHIIMDKHVKWLKTLPRYIEVENYFITHGFCLPYYKRRADSSSHIGLLKNRITDEAEWGDDWEEGWRDYDIVNIFGHTDYEEVEVGENYYGIDTGCVYGRKLTAIELGTMRIYQQSTDPEDIG